VTITSHAARTLLGVALLAAAGCKAEPTPLEPVRAPIDPAFADLSFLVGSWANTDADGVSTEEHWTDARGGAMFGVNRVIRDGKTVFYENLRIERAADGSIVYLASPAGRMPPTVFTLTVSSSHHAMFENPDHDFPQRIAYEDRGNGSLRMAIGDREYGEPKNAVWTLHRVPGSGAGGRPRPVH
jgi:hypothetical protein